MLQVHTMRGWEFVCGMRWEWDFRQPQLPCLLYRKILTRGLQTRLHRMPSKYLYGTAIHHCVRGLHDVQRRNYLPVRRLYFLQGHRVQRVPSMHDRPVPNGMHRHDRRWMLGVRRMQCRILSL